MEQSAAKPIEQNAGRPWWIWLIVAIIAALVALMAWGLVNNTEARPEVGDPLPPLDFTLYDGYEYLGQTQLTSADLANKVVVINFWASWCVECTYEADDLEAIWQSYPQDEVVVLGVAYIDEEAPSIAFMERYGLTYPNGPDLGSILSEDQYYITGVPETFVFGPDGTLAASYIGPVEQADLRAVIDRLRTANSQ